MTFGRNFKETLNLEPQMGLSLPDLSICIPCLALMRNPISFLCPLDFGG